jgi:hypothetical protein
VTVAALAAAVVAAPPARAAGPKAGPEPIIEAVRTAVASGHVWQGKMKGFPERHTFTEVPAPGTLLIGFDVGLGLFGGDEMIYSLRPIYRTDDGEGFVASHGLFPEDAVGAKPRVRTNMTRTVKVRARPGYAVGGIYLRTGLIINGMAVTFMRIDGRNLDATQAYTSEWIGDRTGGSEEYLGGGGSPAVGVYGREDDKHVSALGLIFASVVPATTRLPATPLPQRPRLPAVATSPARVSPPSPADVPPAVPLLPSGQEPTAPAAARPVQTSGNGAWWPAMALGALAGGLILVGLFVGARTFINQPRTYDAIVVADDEPLTPLRRGRRGHRGSDRPHGAGEPGAAAGE